MAPRVDLYTICWNEEFMLPYFFRHYDEIVQRYVVFDDGSTDRTRQILESHPRVEVRPLPDRGADDSYVLVAQQIHEQCWKESRGRADWVIVTAVDELLYAPRFESQLEAWKEAGVTAVPALGYQMLSPTLPTGERSLLELVRRGCPWKKMNKLSLFDPDEVLETRQIPGRHRADPVGNIRYPETDVLLLLHYKYLSPNYAFDRHIKLRRKLGTGDHERGFGVHYDWTRREFDRDWKRFNRRAVPDVFDPAYNPDLQHPKRWRRWWRRDEAEPRAALAAEG